MNNKQKEFWTWIVVVTITTLVVNFGVNYLFPNPPTFANIEEARSECEGQGGEIEYVPISGKGFANPYAGFKISCISPEKELFKIEVK